jgi:hypothetical protein
MDLKVGQRFVELGPRHLDPVQEALAAHVDVHRHDGDAIFLYNLRWEVAAAVGHNSDQGTLPSTARACAQFILGKSYHNGKTLSRF